MARWTMTAALAVGLATLGVGVMAQSRPEDSAPEAIPSQPETQPRPKPAAKPPAPESKPAPEGRPDPLQAAQAEMVEIEAEMAAIRQVTGMLGEFEAAAATAELQSEWLEGRLRAYMELLQKVNFGVPRELGPGAAEAEEQAKLVAEVTKEFEQLTGQLGESKAMIVMARWTRAMLAAKHPELITDEIEATLAPPPADQERRLRELERKLDRVLKILDSRGSDRGLPAGGQDETEG